MDDGSAGDCDVGVYNMSAVVGDNGIVDGGMGVVGG